MRAQLFFRSGTRPPRSLVAVACAAAIAGPGLLSASPAQAASGPAWVKDTNVAYQVGTACAVPGTASDTYGDVYRPASPSPGPLPSVVPMVRERAGNPSSCPHRLKGLSCPV